MEAESALRRWGDWIFSAMLPCEVGAYYLAKLTERSGAGGRQRAALVQPRVVGCCAAVLRPLPLNLQHLRASARPRTHDTVQDSTTWFKP